MIEQTLRALCESRFRWLIVTAGTFAVGLVLVLPLVDLYSAERKEKAALSAELESARQAVEKIEQVEQQAAEKTAQLQAFEARTVDEESLADLRAGIVGLARDTGCSLRRLNVGTMSSRPWLEADDPVGTAAAAAQADGPQSGFVLQWWPINVSLSGSDTGLKRLLEQLESENRLMHARSFDMQPASAGRKTVALDMELWFFNLSRGR